MKLGLLKWMFNFFHFLSSLPFFLQKYHLPKKVKYSYENCLITTSFAVENLHCVPHDSRKAAEEGQHRSIGACMQILSSCWNQNISDEWGWWPGSWLSSKWAPKGSFSPSRQHSQEVCHTIPLSLCLQENLQSGSHSVPLQRFYYIP